MAKLCRRAQEDHQLKLPDHRLNVRTECVYGYTNCAPPRRPKRPSFASHRDAHHGSSSVRLEIAGKAPRRLRGRVVGNGDSAAGAAASTGPRSPPPGGDVAPSTHHSGSDAVTAAAGRSTPRPQPKHPPPPAPLPAEELPTCTSRLAFFSVACWLANTPRMAAV
jgi:hypothetical protein